MIRLHTIPLLLFAVSLIAIQLKADDSKFFRRVAGNGYPVAVSTRLTGPITLIERSGYTVGYSKKLRQCVWVAYRMIPDDLKSPVARSNNFRPDLFCFGALRPGDYIGTGYDRGHMAPAGDMGFSSRSMRESFLMGNIVPQTPQLNRGPWKRLETATRQHLLTPSGDAAARYIYVVSGPIFSKEDIEQWENLCEKRSHNAKIPLLKPRAFFKVTKQNLKIKATVMDHNTLCCEHVSLGKLRKLTGLNMLPAQPIFLGLSDTSFKTPTDSEDDK